MPSHYISTQAQVERVKLSAATAKLIVDSEGNCDLIYLRGDDGDFVCLSPWDIARIIKAGKARGVNFSLEANGVNET